jgi:hypothetical protein
VYVFLHVTVSAPLVMVWVRCGLGEQRVHTSAKKIKLRVASFYFNHQRGGVISDYLLAQKGGFAGSPGTGGPNDPQTGFALETYLLMLQLKINILISNSPANSQLHRRLR